MKKGEKVKVQQKENVFMMVEKKMFFQQNDDLIDVIGQVCQIEVWFCVEMYSTYICVKLLDKILIYIINAYFMLLKIQKIVHKQYKHFTEILMTFPISFQTKM
jgi:hypothetical protein